MVSILDSATVQYQYCLKNYVFVQLIAGIMERTPLCNFL
jgi:hypothetical protein